MGEAAGPVGAALGLAVASGLSLCGAVFVTGLAIRLGWVHLAPAWTSLGVLADPVVLGASGVLFAVEFLADSRPPDQWISVAFSRSRPTGGAALSRATCCGGCVPI
jgi:hypothetical protein